MVMSLYIEGGSGTGWTIYPPLSSVEYHRNIRVDFTGLSLHLAGVSSIGASINFITSCKNIPV